MLFFFSAYLISMIGTAARVTPTYMRKRAAFQDEGTIIIVLLALTGVSLSLGSMFALLNAPGKPDTLHLVLSMISVPLGWATLHTIMAFHYAHLFYAKHTSRDLIDAGGLVFPQTDEPGSWDFLYYSFVVGMTAQVSDVQVVSTPMRQITLAHGIVSFFFQRGHPCSRRERRAGSNALIAAKCDLLEHSPVRSVPVRAVTCALGELSLTKIG